MATIGLKNKSVLSEITDAPIYDGHTNLETYYSKEYRAFDRDIQAYREINWISWLAILKRDLMKLDRHTIILYKVSQKLYMYLLRNTFTEAKSET